MTFRLEIEYEGETHEARFDQDVVKIGRDSESDVILDDNTVSRNHARIQVDDGAYSLSVLSKNGLTAVAGERVTGRVELEDGAVLHFGTIKCVFHLIEDAATVVGEGASEVATEKNPAVIVDLDAGADDDLAEPGAPTEKHQPIRADDKSAANEAADRDEKVRFEDAPTEVRDTARHASDGHEEDTGSDDSRVVLEDEPTEFLPVEELAKRPVLEDEPTQFRPVEEAATQAGEPAEDRPPKAAEDEPDETDEKQASEDVDQSGEIISWDDIASSEEAADELDEYEKPASDFQKIQAAAEKAKRQSRTDPIKLAVGIAMIAGLLAFTLFYDTAAPLIAQEPEEVPREVPPITFMPGEIDCIEEAECMAAAKRSYKIGMERLDHIDVVVSNRFDGWKRLVMTERYVEKAGRTELPDTFEKLEERKEKARTELDELYRSALQNYDHHSRYKMYAAMVDALNAVKAQFPHEGAREFKWAVSQERLLKTQGNYPMHMRRGPNRR